MKNKLLFLFLISIILTGCNPYQNLNQLGLAHSIQVGKNNNTYQLVFNILTPTQENLYQTKQYMVECQKLNQCMENIYQESSKKIYLEHLELLILNETIQQKDLKEISYFFLEQKDSRTTFPVIIINQSDFLTSYITDDILNIITMNEEETGLSSLITLEEVIKQQLLDEEIYLPYLSLNNELKLLGMAKITNQITPLSHYDSIYLNLLQNNAKHVFLTYQDISYEIKNPFIQTKLKNNQIEIHISSSLDITSCSKNTTSLKQIFEDNLKKELLDFLKNNWQQHLNSFWNRHNNTNESYSDIHITFDTTINQIRNEVQTCNKK